MLFPGTSQTRMTRLDLLNSQWENSQLWDNMQKLFDILQFNIIIGKLRAGRR